MKKIIQTLVVAPLFALAQHTPFYDYPPPLVISNGSVENNTIVLTKDNTLVFNTEFTAETVANLTKRASNMDSTVSSVEPLYLVLNSPGGSIDAGIELIENLSNLNRPVKTLSLWAASMGFHTVQGLDERLITKNGTLMSHKPRGSFSGEFPGQLDSRYEYYLRRIKRMDESVVSRTKGKHTLETYRNLTENEYWCDGEDCLSQGFVDRVVRPKCNESLKGTKWESLKKLFVMGMSIDIMAEFDNCPLNTNPLQFQIFVDGKPLFKAGNPEKIRWVVELVPGEVLTLTASSIFEIEQKANEVIFRYKNREVVKGF